MNKEKNVKKNKSKYIDIHVTTSAVHVYLLMNISNTKQRLICLGIVINISNSMIVFFGRKWGESKEMFCFGSGKTQGLILGHTKILATQHQFYSSTLSISVKVLGVIPSHLTVYKDVEPTLIFISKGFS